MAANSFGIGFIETVKVFFNISGVGVSGVSVTLTGASFGSETLETDSNGCAFFLATVDETLTATYNYFGQEGSENLDFTFTGLGDIVLFDLPLTVVLSEIKTIKINRDCSNQNILLTWLNSLGGWEYWNFTARKTFGVSNTDTRIIERDIFQDWDTEFINGQTQFDIISREDRPSTIVRSQRITKEDIEVLQKIRTSIKVQDITDLENPVTVIVDPGSFEYFTDREKLVTLDFRILYPKLITQKQ